MINQTLTVDEIPSKLGDLARHPPHGYIWRIVGNIGLDLCGDSCIGRVSLSVKPHDDGSVDCFVGVFTPGEVDPHCISSCSLDYALGYIGREVGSLERASC
jgi:hypothetical protein